MYYARAPYSALILLAGSQACSQSCFSLKSSAWTVRSIRGGTSKLKAALESDAIPEVYPHYAGRRAVEEGQEPMPRAGIVLVDSFCDYLGLHVANEVRRRGFACVQVLSDHLLSYMNDESAESFRAPAQGIETHLWAAELPFPILGAVSESDAGLETAERLQADLCPNTGGVNSARREKYAMNEALRSAGLAAVRQAKAAEWSDVAAFVASLTATNTEAAAPAPAAAASSTTASVTTSSSSTSGMPHSSTTADTAAAADGTISSTASSSASSSSSSSASSSSSSSGSAAAQWVPLVVKPCRGCASGDVYLCSTEQQARAALQAIIGTPLYASPGAVNTEVLVQEFLEGQEYVVDTVSSSSVHKVMAVWKYDKRPANGAAFVYHRTQLIPCSTTTDSSSIGSSSSSTSSRSSGSCSSSDTTAVQATVTYARRALDALGVVVGTAHIEIIMTRDGPRLVEYNGRWHLTDFRPLCNECIGYNAIDATIDAHLDHEAFEALPNEPQQLLKAGCVVHLVCHVTGHVAAVQHVEQIKALRSFRAIDVYATFAAGEQVTPTIDIRSDAGWVRLCHADAAVVEADYQLIVSLMPTMFTVAEDTPAVSQ